MKLLAYCRQCGHKHPIDQNPARPDNQVIDWYVKHAGCEGVGLINPMQEPRRTKRLLRIGWGQLGEFRRWLKGRSILGLPAQLRAYGMPVPATQLELLQFASNATVKITYAASVAFTITLASLATSSTLVAGRQGAVVTNSSNLYLDYLIAGLITTGTTPTVSTFIETWMIAGLDDTPNYPDALSTSDAAFTTTSRNQLFTYGAPVAASIVTATSNVGYAFRGVSLASLFGGICPRDFAPFITHSTAVNLHATGGNHYIKQTGVYLTVA